MIMSENSSATKEENTQYIEISKDLKYYNLIKPERSSNIRWNCLALYSDGSDIDKITDISSEPECQLLLYIRTNEPYNKINIRILMNRSRSRIRPGIERMTFR